MSSVRLVPFSGNHVHVFHTILPSYLHTCNLWWLCSLYKKMQYSFPKMREKERGSKAVWNISENLSVMVPWPVPEWHQVVQKCSHSQYDCQQVVHKLSQICHQTITKLSLGRLKVAPQKFQSSPQVFLMYSPSSPKQIPTSISPASCNQVNQVVPI